jgi:hypothetical protein
MSIFEKLLGSGSAPAEPIVGVIEPISIQRADGTMEEGVLSVVDTTKLQSLIDKKFAQELGLYTTDQVLERETILVKGRERLADVIEVSFEVSGRPARSRWFVIDRSEEKHFIVLGRNDLRGFLVKIPDGE